MLNSSVLPVKSTGLQQTDVLFLKHGDKLLRQYSRTVYHTCLVYDLFLSHELKSVLYGPVHTDETLLKKKLTVYNDE